MDKKKIILIGGLIIIFISIICICCIPSKEDKLIENSKEVTRKQKEGAKLGQTNNTLPYGFNFNMSAEKVNQIVDSLNSQGILDGRRIPNYNIGDSILQNCGINFFYGDSGTIYEMDITYQKNDYEKVTDALFEYVRKQLDNQLKDYERIDYTYFGDTKIRKPWSSWFKGNKQVILKDGSMGDEITICYINLPVSEPIKSESAKREIERSRKKREFERTIRMYW